MTSEMLAAHRTQTSNCAIDLQSYVAGVVEYEAETRERFASLYRKNVATHPVPFFGDVCNAKVLTVGVNPSAEEFEGGRWPVKLSPIALTMRLLSYFEEIDARRHGWFDLWEQALAKLNLSYRSGAAHLDLSPRATVSMGVADPAMFRDMVKEDADWFFRLLPLCNAARCILIAGTVTKSTYAHKFLHRVAQIYDFTLSGDLRTKGCAHTSLLRLTGQGVSLPVFFCSVSPSARQNKHLLPIRVAESAPRIRSRINGDSG